MNDTKGAYVSYSYFTAENHVTSNLVLTSWVKNVNWPPYRASKLTFNRSNEGLTLETSAFQLFTVANLRFHSVAYTKLLCYTLPPTQYQFL